MILYHGSDHIIERPVYGKGNVHNDYGLGFYTTQDLELAKEWSAKENALAGFVNKYSIDLKGLKVLDLDEDGYGILNWIATLVQNRVFALKRNIMQSGKDFLIANYSLNLNGFDIIIGWRADDAYFRYAQDFLNNAITVAELNKAMRLGNLGKQVVIKSKKAFSLIRFIEAEEVDISRYGEMRAKREKMAKEEYFSFEKHDIQDTGYLSNIMAESSDSADSFKGKRYGKKRDKGV